MENKMLIDVMGLESVSRRAIVGCSNDSRMLVPPVRGSIKRKMLVLLYHKMKLLGRVAVHFISSTSRQH
ncbi:conserved hypothetical protein [Ricinus communis]|uniref:Uncharacterized protein n=1 Tax=Ricinus communis TaxID=3988 RepID=B9S2Q2_RICCO|nr:conserved hypothetical protein [Ricinus communis]